MMKILGLDEEEFHRFESVVYKDCITLGIKHDHSLSSENTPFPEIPDYIEQQETRKRKQEQDARKVDAKTESM
jgi:hypothetical protein